MARVEALPTDSDIRASLVDVMRSGKCHEVVMIFYHHLPSQARAEAVQENLVVPLLADGIPSRDSVKDYIMKERRRRLEESEGETTTTPVPTDYDPACPAGMDGPSDDPMYNTLAQALVDQLGQSPCLVAHSVLDKPWDDATAAADGISKEIRDEIIHKNSFTRYVDKTSHPLVFPLPLPIHMIFVPTQHRNGVLEEGDEIPDTTIEGATYVNCGEPEKCEAGADRSYRLQAVVRAYRVPGSKNILVARENQAPAPIHSQGKDVIFHTRAFEAMPGSKSAWGPDKAGGNGTLGMLGPAIVANPGERMHLFVMNNLADTAEIGPILPTKQRYYERMEASGVEDGCRVMWRGLV